MVAETAAVGRVAEAARVRVVEGTVAGGMAAEVRAVAARGWAVAVREEVGWEAVARAAAAKAAAAETARVAVGTVAAGMAAEARAAAVAGKVVAVKVVVEQVAGETVVVAQAGMAETRTRLPRCVRGSRTLPQKFEGRECTRLLAKR